MKLSIKDRLQFPKLLPEQGNIVTQLLAKDISEKVSVTSDEAREISLRQLDNGMIQWNNEKAKVKEIEFSEAEIAFLRSQVQKLDEGGKITQDLLAICLQVQEYKKPQAKEDVATAQ